MLGQEVGNRRPKDLLPRDLCTGQWAGKFLSLPFPTLSQILALPSSRLLPLTPGPRKGHRPRPRGAHLGPPLEMLAALRRSKREALAGTWAQPDTEVGSSPMDCALGGYRVAPTNTHNDKAKPATRPESAPWGSQCQPGSVPGTGSAHSIFTANHASRRPHSINCSPYKTTPLKAPPTPLRFNWPCLFAGPVQQEPVPMKPRPSQDTAHCPALT